MATKVLKHSNGNIIVVDIESNLLMQHSEETGMVSVSLLPQGEAAFMAQAIVDNGLGDITEVSFEGEEDVVSLGSVLSRITEVVSAVKAK